MCQAVLVIVILNAPPICGCVALGGVKPSRYAALPWVKPMSKSSEKNHADDLVTCLVRICHCKGVSLSLLLTCGRVTVQCMVHLAGGASARAENAKSEEFSFLIKTVVN